MAGKSTPPTTVFRHLWWGRGRNATEVVECRDCGKTLRCGDARECPSCGSGEIARYVIGG